MSQAGRRTEAAHRRFTAGALFSGMGGFADGMSRAGFDVRWANDSDAAACSTFRHRFPGVPVFERDVGELFVEADRLEPVDVLAAGFPCQSFSQAGNRRGFRDRRGQTFLQIRRLIEDFGEDEKPFLVVLENVPHLLHGAGGAWFDLVRRELRRAGYWFRRSACWVVNVKDATHLPQDRERLFMVAASRTHFDYNPFTPPAAGTGTANAEPAPIRRPLNDFIDRSRRREESEYLSPHNRYFKMIAQKMKSGDDRNIYQLRRSYVREKKGRLCPTLTANMGIGGHNVPFVRDAWGIRRLGVYEIARLQGIADPESTFPEGLTATERYRLLGNAVCVDLAAAIAARCRKILVEHRVRRDGGRKP